MSASTPVQTAKLINRMTTVIATSPAVMTNWKSVIPMTSHPI